MSDSMQQEDASEFSEFIGRHSGKILTGLVALVIGIGGVIYSGHRSFSDYFNNNPPKGLIAYSKKNVINVVDSRNLKSMEGAKKIQMNEDIRDLLWLDNDEIVYNSCGPGSHISDHLYKVNINNGEIKTLFDPYSPDMKTFFGDIKTSEDNLRKQHEADIEELKKEKRSYIVYTDFRAVKINKFGLDRQGKDIYIRMGDLWYCLDSDGNNFKKPTILPNDLVVDQLDCPEGKYSISDDVFGVKTLIKKDSNANFGIEFEFGAKNPAWFSE